MRERRAHPRLKKKSEVSVKITAAPDVPEIEGTTLSCSTENLSVGGLYFRTAAVLPAGAELELEVRPGRSRESFAFHGRVAWMRREGKTREYAVGVYFTGTPIATLNAWSHWLDTQRET